MSTKLPPLTAIQLARRRARNQRTFERTLATKPRKYNQFNWMYADAAGMTRAPIERGKVFSSVWLPHGVSTVVVGRLTRRIIARTEPYWTLRRAITHCEHLQLWLKQQVLLDLDLMYRETIP